MADKMMDRIQKLLNQAASAGLDSPEGKVFQAKAEELMHSHRIDQAMLRIRNAAKAAEEVQAAKPTDRTVAFVDRTNEFHDQLCTTVAHLARLAGVRIVFRGWDEIHAVGYPNDIDYFQMLWVSTHLTFSGRMFPEWDCSKDDGDNIRAFAESGYKWLHIWTAARRAGCPMKRKNGEEVPAPPNDGGYMKRVMKRSYDRDGIEKPKLTHAVGNYRLSYAQGFVDVVTARADAMWAERRRRENASGDGVSLVLAKDANAVEEYFNSLYPPGSLTPGQASRRRGTHEGARTRGRAAGSAVDFSAGQGGVSGASRQEIGQ